MGWEEELVVTLSLLRTDEKLTKPHNSRWGKGVAHNDSATSQPTLLFLSLLLFLLFILAITRPFFILFFVIELHYPSSLQLYPPHRFLHTTKSCPTLIPTHRSVFPPSPQAIPLLSLILFADHTMCRSPLPYLLKLATDKDALNLHYNI